jgi:RND superfamily putative drug exporter
VNSILADHFKQPQEDTVLVHLDTETVADPAFRATVADLTRTVGAIPVVLDVRPPQSWSRDDRVSADRHSVRVTIRLRTVDLDPAQRTDLPVAHALAAVAARHSGMKVEELGLNAYKINDAVNQDFGKPGIESLPITLIVLVVVFGALVATGLSLLLALTSVAATTGLLALPRHLLPLDQSVSVIVLLIGLAVGVDYAMCCWPDPN